MAILDLSEKNREWIKYNVFSDSNEPRYRMVDLIATELLKEGSFKLYDNASFLLTRGSYGYLIVYEVGIFGPTTRQPVESLHKEHVSQALLLLTRTLLGKTTKALIFGI